MNSIHLFCCKVLTTCFAACSALVQHIYVKAFTYFFCDQIVRSQQVFSLVLDYEFKGVHHFRISILTTEIVQKSGWNIYTRLDPIVTHLKIGLALDGRYTKAVI